MVMGTGSQLTYADTLGYLRNSIDVIIHTGRTDANRGVQEIYFPGLSQTEQAA
jgi:type IV secretion system protein VirB11